MNLKLAGAAGEIEVSAATFDKEFNQGLIHQVVSAYLAGARQGTRAQKTRAEVKLTGKKPWRQKGTGRARSGTAASPIWRSGGVTFAAKPQNHSQKVNKKMYRAALRSMLSELARQDRIQVVESLVLAEPKTKLLTAKLSELNLQKVLIIIDELDTNLYLAARNLPFVEVIPAASVNPVSLVAYDNVLATVAAVRKLEERLA